jgi:polysaccharide pyruvyl transferase WcaK-like protein
LVVRFEIGILIVMIKGKVLIAGRVNHDNYGDTLMVAIVASYCTEQGYEVFVLGSGDFLVRQLKEIGIDVTNIDREYLHQYDFDRCIFTGGGYLAHNFFNGRKWCGKWLKDAYFTDAYHYLKDKGIPYCVLSVEVGPVQSKDMRQVVRQIFDDAKIVYVRNEQSLFFTQNNITKSDHVMHSQDMVLTELSNLVTSMSGKGLLNLYSSDTGRVSIGVHVTDKFDGSNFLKRKFVDELISVINSDPQVTKVVLFSDNEETTTLDDAFNYLAKNISNTKNVSIHRFHSLKEVLEVINQCSHVLTTKLHVGVSAISLGKHVLCLSDTPKSRRFYESIGFSGAHKNFYLRSPFSTKKHVLDFFNSRKVADLGNLRKGFYKIIVEKFL